MDILHVNKVYITARYASRNVCIASLIYSPRIYTMYKKLRLCYIRDCVAVPFLFLHLVFFSLLIPLIAHTRWTLYIFFW